MKSFWQNIYRPQGQTRLYWCLWMAFLGVVMVLCSISMFYRGRTGLATFDAFAAAFDFLCATLHYLSWQDWKKLQNPA